MPASSSQSRQRAEPRRKTVHELSKPASRKPKKAQIAPPTILPTSQIPFDDDDIDADGLEDYDSLDDLPGNNPRRSKALERNRVAAKKCRVRKRDEASALAHREQTVEDQNRYLSSCFSSLSNEINLLKSELLRHTHCNCTLIQEYITNEARRSVDRLNSSPSTAALTSRTTPSSLETPAQHQTTCAKAEPSTFENQTSFANLTARPDARNKQAVPGAPFELAPECDGVLGSPNTIIMDPLSGCMPADSFNQPLLYDADARWPEQISGQPMTAP